MELSLIVVEGQPLGAVVTVKTNRFQIGRDPSCQLRPRNPSISKFQCALIREGAEAFVEDLNSANGTLVNDLRLRNGERVRIHDGDRLQVGQLIFAIRIAARGRRGANRPEDWLNDPQPAAENSSDQTLLLKTLSQGSSSNESSLVPTSPPPSSDPLAKFADRWFDEERRVACLGLNPDQVLDESEIGATGKAIFALVSEQKYARIILDLKHVESLPSTAVALLVAMANRCRSAGGGVRLCGLGPDLKKKLAALRLEAICGCYPNRSAALSASWD